MKIKTTSDCKLILEGAPKSGKEILLYNYEEVISIDREDDSNVYTYKMEKDGLYQYFVLTFSEEEQPEDLVDYINDYKIDPEVTDSDTPAEVFSICHLRNCLLEKEKEMINSFLKDCGGKAKCNSSSDKSPNDFLLVSVFLLENLICRGNYQEALRILEGISGCNGVCGEKSNTKKCNCCG